MMEEQNVIPSEGKNLGSTHTSYNLLCNAQPYVYYRIETSISETHHQTVDLFGLLWICKPRRMHSAPALDWEQQSVSAYKNRSDKGEEKTHLMNDSQGTAFNCLYTPQLYVLFELFNTCLAM